MKKTKYEGIRDALKEIIKGTQWEGHVFLVGGCVRDDMMHAEIHDVDIALDTPNGGILFAQWLYDRRLSARKPILFEHFGTAKVRLKMYPHDIIDCVQTRKSRYIYEEEPKPEEYFGTIEEDALCRDLTINSLFLNVSTGELLDPTGHALSDIENHIIRTPNDPDISLRDNAMHILRTIRFAVKYGWHIDQPLLESMMRNTDIMKEATLRRMTNELAAILKLKDKKRALALIKKVGAWQYVEPYLQIMNKRKKKETHPNPPSKGGGRRNGKGSSGEETKKKSKHYYRHKKRRKKETEQ